MKNAKTITIADIAGKVGIDPKTARAKVRAAPGAFPKSREEGRYVYDIKAAKQVERTLAV